MTSDSRSVLPGYYLGVFQVVVYLCFLFVGVCLRLMHVDSCCFRLVAGRCDLKEDDLAGQTLSTTRLINSIWGFPNFLKECYALLIGATTESHVLVNHV